MIYYKQEQKLPLQSPSETKKELGFFYVEIRSRGKKKNKENLEIFLHVQIYQLISLEPYFFPSLSLAAQSTNPEKEN
jgi:hypothetical protein